MREADSKLIEAMREYRESLEKMTPEERKKEEARMKAWEEFLYPKRQSWEVTDDEDARSPQEVDRNSGRVERKEAQVDDENAKLAKALQSLKGTPPPTDTKPFLGNLSNRPRDLFKKK